MIPIKYTSRLATGLVFLLVFITTGFSQNRTLPPTPQTIPPTPPPVTDTDSPTNLEPIEHLLDTPVDQFRKLLELQEQQRNQTLQSFPAQQRNILCEKLGEYDSMPEPQRRLRLRTAELGWFMKTLIQTDKPERADKLSALPELYQEWFEYKLNYWDEISPDKQNIILASDKMFGFFLHSPQPPPMPSSNKPPPMPPEKTEKNELLAALNKWRALPSDKQERIYQQFQNFLQLTEQDKQKAIRELNRNQRTKMEKHLRTLNNMSPANQRNFLESFRKLTNLEDIELQRFLQGARKWHSMTLPEKLTFKHLANTIPPLPPGLAKPPFPTASASNIDTPPLPPAN
ncbi:MAG: hypothetical protein K9N48_05785 [Verrucomicrobia bacterium]|nr:hypothetical protein [Verrucomicrobiota bacterium]MCF7708894.1 hypothetical protein [Verrucomicrobiota bacterium]